MGRVQVLGWLVVTIMLDLSPGAVCVRMIEPLPQPAGVSSRMSPGLQMTLSFDDMSKATVGAFGTPSSATVSGAGLCVGPMMKLPSAPAGGSAPPGSSTFFT